MIPVWVLDFALVLGVMKFGLPVRLKEDPASLYLYCVPRRARLRQNALCFWLCAVVVRMPLLHVVQLVRVTWYTALRLGYVARAAGGFHRWCGGRSAHEGSQVRCFFCLF